MATYNDLIAAMSTAISDRQQKYYQYQPPESKYNEWIPIGNSNYGRSRYITTGRNVYTNPESYLLDASKWINDEYNTYSFIDWLQKQYFDKTVTPFKKEFVKRDISIEEFDRLLMGDMNE